VIDWLGWIGSLFNLLLIILVILAVLVVEFKNLLYAAIIAGFYSVIVAVLYFMLQAPDIALTQIVVGVGLQTAILIIAISKTLRVEESSESRNFGLKTASLTVIAILTLILVFTVIYDFPVFGEPAGRVGQYYVENVLRDVGAWNAVGAIVWDYRGYDTLGETLVLFTAVIIVLAVLRHESRKRDEPNS
jgi:uncharacterized MnhB-related membrane protein